MTFPVLSALILAPFLGAVVVMLLPERRKELALPLGVALSMIPVGLAGWLFLSFEPNAEFQFVEQAVWYEPWGISWHVAVDGIALPLVVLTTILVPISLAASTAIADRIRMFVSMVLLLEAGLIGVFVSLDLFVFFAFFEVILLPMYFIIGIWGSEDRIYAAVKFFLFTAFGSALMLAGIVALGLIHQNETGVLSFNYLDLLDVSLTRKAEGWLFASFALAFAIKVPVFPLHTWLPDAHVQAPTAGSVLLAGVLLKLGTYGFLRFNLPLFPRATVDAVPLLATLAVIGIIYGAAVAIMQRDLKKLVAYSSVSHMGFILLGTFALTSAGVRGGLVQMVNHGISTGALFLLVGMMYERRHSRLISDYGGVAKAMPLMAGIFLFMSFASIGLPGLNGFVGEFLVLLGSYRTLPVYTILAALGVVLAAVYLLWAYERVFTGEITSEENRRLSDVGLREIVLLVPLIALVLVLGLYPKVLLDRVGPATDSVVNRVAAVTEVEAVGG